MEMRLEQKEEEVQAMAERMGELRDELEESKAEVHRLWEIIVENE